MTLNETTDPLADYVSDFTHRRVLVVGDAILDEYLLGDCSRISPEAPVPVLKVNASRHVLGGAANTAANIVSLGGHATLIALVGDDEGGRTLRRCARDAGVDLLAVDHGLATLRKTRVVGQHQQIVRLDYEDIQTPGPLARVGDSHAVRRLRRSVRHRRHLRLRQGVPVAVARRRRSSDAPTSRHSRSSSILVRSIGSATAAATT